MRFIGKSITRKLFLSLLILTVILGLVFVYFVRIDVVLVPLRTVIISFSVLIAALVLIYWLDVAKPLHVVLAQVQAVLAGKDYRKIYTERIDEVGILAHFFNQVTEGFGEVSHDIKDRERMMKELSVASQLQRDILPLRSPDIQGLQIVAKTKAATELGGDSFNFFEANGKVFIYVGDVTGHGVAAGLIMTMVNSLINVFADLYGNCYEILVNVNRYIKKHVKKAMFMTLVMLSWDPKKGVLTYVGAGHEHILVYRSDTGACEAILSGGVALGMVEDNSKLISEKEIQLRDDDLVVLYTDGLTEAKGKDGTLFGLDRLKQAVQEFAPQYSAEGVNFHVAQRVTDFMSHQDDDMTLIVIKKGAMTEKVKDQSTNWA